MTKIPVLLLAAAVFSSPSALATPAAPCADFNRYKGGDTLDPISRVDDLEVSSYPANRIRIYDPADDRGPTGAIGAEIRNRLAFETASGRFATVRLRYVSDSPGPALLTVLNRKGVVLRTVKLKARPQNTLLRKVVGGLSGAAQVLVDHPGEVFISRLCFSR